MLDQKELLRRLRLDFPKSEAEVQAEIREIKPDFDFAEMPRHIASGELESMVLEGERRYFRRAARNLFRINPKLKAYYEANYGDDNEPRHRFLAEYLPNFIQNPEPKTFHFHFQVKLKENESLDSAIRRFKRQCARSGVLSELRKRECYEKPSAKRGGGRVHFPL